MEINALGHENMPSEHFLMVQWLHSTRQARAPQPIMDGVEPLDTQLAGQIVLQVFTLDQEIIRQSNAVIGNGRVV